MASVGLAIGNKNYGVGYDGGYSNEFSDRFPPGRALIPALLGFVIGLVGVAQHS